MNCCTWNMQGANYSTEDKWNLCVSNFITNGVEIAFLQECGNLPSSVSFLQNNFMGVNGLQCCQWGGTATRPKSTIVFFQADPGANRCNLAIVLRASFTIDDAFLLRGAGGPQWRPVIGVQVQGAVYFCIHAISPSGPDAPYLIDAAQQLTPLWMMAGDFNQEPDSLN